MEAVIAYSNTGAEQYIRAGMDPARVFVAVNAVTPDHLPKSSNVLLFFVTIRHKSYLSAGFRSANDWMFCSTLWLPCHWKRNPI
jgi:hypothetical protein